MCTPLNMCGTLPIRSQNALVHMQLSSSLSKDGHDRCACPDSIHPTIILVNASLYFRCMGSHGHPHHPSVILLRSWEADPTMLPSYRHPSTSTANLAPRAKQQKKTRHKKSCPNGTRMMAEIRMIILEFRMTNCHHPSASPGLG